MEPREASSQLLQDPLAAVVSHSYPLPVDPCLDALSQYDSPITIFRDLLCFERQIQDQVHRCSVRLCQRSYRDWPHYDRLEFFDGMAADDTGVSGACREPSEFYASYHA